LDNWVVDLHKETKNMVDATCNTNDLMQMVDVTCDTNDLMEVIDRKTTNDMSDDSLIGYGIESFIKMK
jgi:hypothetical protein